jgi:hypothetical protein
MYLQPEALKMYLQHVFTIRGSQDVFTTCIYNQRLSRCIYNMYLQSEALKMYLQHVFTTVVVKKILYHFILLHYNLMEKTASLV